MYRINSASSLEMDEIEEVRHLEENEQILSKIQAMNNFPCAILEKFQDPKNMHKEQRILTTELHDIMELVSRYDSKNGVDFFYSSDNFLVMQIYGALYESDGAYHYHTVALKIMPYDSSEQFVNIVSGVFDNLL